MKILVTGCSGFIGTNLCPYLASRGHTVTGIDHRVPHIEPDQRWDYEPCDLLDEGMLVKFSNRGYDCIIHLAGKDGACDSLLNPGEYIDANVRTTANLLVHFARVDRFVLASSSSVYGNAASDLADDRQGCPEGSVWTPVSPYAATKCAAEDLVHSWWRQYKSFGFSSVALRLFTCYGPWNRRDMAMYRWAESIRKGEDLHLFGRGMRRDWTPVADVVHGITLAAELKVPGHGVFNLGSGDSVEVEQMIKWLYYAMRPGRGEPTIVDVGTQPGDVLATWSSTELAYEVLGWVPKVGYETGIRDFVKWYDSVNPQF